MTSTLKIEKWLYEKLTSELSLPVYNILPDVQQFPNILIEGIEVEPWLIKPASERITFAITINSVQTSNEEILSISNKVSKLLAAKDSAKPDSIIRQKISDFESRREGKYWKSNIEIMYYILQE